MLFKFHQIIFVSALVAITFAAPSRVSYANPHPDLNPNVDPFTLTENRYRPGTLGFDDRGNLNAGGHGGHEKYRVARSPDGWRVEPNLSRDQKGNTAGSVHVEKKVENGRIEADWGKTIRGPGKSGDTWRVGGSFEW